MTNAASSEVLVNSEAGQMLNRFVGIASSTWARASAVAICYYCGGQIDTILHWSKSPAMLWPPNAVLLSALMLVRQRRWWIYVLAIFPADRAIGWNLPLLTGLSLFASNTVQTLIAASLIRLGERGLPRWDEPVYVLRFIFAAGFAGPCMGGLLASWTLHGSFYGATLLMFWREWLTSNALTMLALVPLLTMVVECLNAALWHSSKVRFRPRGEAIVVFGILIAVAVAVFEARWLPSEAVAPLLCAPLPVLLWVALRFGPGSASAAQMVLVLIAVHGSAIGRGPFPADGAGNVFHLQTILIATSLPLLLLSAVHLKELEERRELLAAHADARRLELRLAQVGRLATAGEIAAAVIHEVFQPLSAVLINAECAKRFLAQRPPDLVELRSALDDISADVKRAKEAGQRLKALLKSGDVERKPVNINELIRQVVRLLNVEMASRNISLALELDPRLPVVTGDSVQLQQVVLNLVVNGCAAVHEAARDHGKLVVRTRAGDCDTIEVAVCDNGTGIESDQLERIFEPFYTTKAEGLGIGLSISRSIIQAHGGSIAAQNNQDRGVTFHFRLPVSAN